MKTIRYFWVTAIIALTAMTQSNGENPAPESFTNLQQAVDFIATALESTNIVAIADACADPNLKPNHFVLTHLQDMNTRKHLRTLYEDKSFPTDAETFKLGGHMSELGFIHIDFVHTNGVWNLKGIWECK